MQDVEELALSRERFATELELLAGRLKTLLVESEVQAASSEALLAESVNRVVEQGGQLTAAQVRSLLLRLRMRVCVPRVSSAWETDAMMHARAVAAAAAACHHAWLG